MRLINIMPAIVMLGISVACNDTKQNISDISDYTSLVNPFIGTDFTGNTYPGAQTPFGMVQLSPDNGLPGWDRIAGYYYPDSTIAGFSHTHLSGTGAGDLYDISFMPVTFPVREAEPPLGIHSRFSHDNESASAGYYSVRLTDYDINVELTATERCGIQRYTFPGGKAGIILNLSKAMNWDRTTSYDVEILDSVTIAGWRHSDGWARDQHLWFKSRFSAPFDSVKIDSIATFYFTTSSGEQITVATALSATGAEGAALNLASEMPDNDFDKYLSQTKARWNKELSKIEVSGDSRDDIVTFYTALYHSMLAPTIYGDCDGTYRGPDKQNHKAEGWTNYGTFSLWDTFRASHPLFTYTQPKRTDDMIKSFLAFYNQNGRLPVWNFQGSETDMMIGYHAVPVIVDAYLKGIGTFDPDSALNACITTANIDDYRQIGSYKQLGYVPYDELPADKDGNWSLSKTLEYAYDDWCIARMAEKMGKIDIAAEFDRRARSYRNLFNPATGWIQPRDKNGNFMPDFNPDLYTEPICESNGWQYYWSVQHDIDDLIALTGGRERFAERLDSMMTYTPDDEDLPIFSTGMVGQYAQGNEPGHHVIYLYNKVGQPEKAQKYLAKVMHELYRNDPAGLPGNEDCGQMSAWYVFSAMGFYPVNPVGGQYELGTPLFKKACIHLDNGKTFTVVAPEVSHKNIYVQSVKVDGKPYDKTYITHDMIMNGSTVEMTMGPAPSIK